MRIVSNVIEMDILRDRFIDRLELHLRSYEISDFALLIEHESGISIEMKQSDTMALTSYILDIEKGINSISLMLKLSNGKQLVIYNENIMVM